MQARQRRQRGRREHWQISRRLMYEKAAHYQRNAQTQLGRSHLAGSSDSESESSSQGNSESNSHGDSHSNDGGAVEEGSKWEREDSIGAEQSEVRLDPERRVSMSSSDECPRKILSPPSDVEGWATLRTQLQLAQAEAEEEVMVLRSQLSAALKKDTLTQHASKAMIAASRKCSAELQTLRKDNLRLQRELCTAQSAQLAATERSCVLESNCKQLQSEADSLAERLREAERCIRAGATDRVRLEDAACTATAQCRRLEAKVLELEEAVREANHAKARGIDALSANAESVAQQVQLLQEAADAQTNELSQQHLARDVAEHRAATLEHEVATLRSELNAARSELQELRDGSIAAAAMAQERKWQLAQRSANVVIRRLSQQLLFRGFGSWKATVRRLRWCRALYKQVLGRMQHRLQHAALSAWRGRMLTSRRHTAILSRCIQKLHLPAQASAFSGWCEHCLMRRRHRLILHRAVARMCNLLAHDALRTWHEFVIQKRHAQDVVLKYLARIRNAAVYTAWCVSIEQSFFKYVCSLDGLLIVG